MLMTRIITIVREWVKLPPSQKLPTYLLAGAIAAIVGLVSIYRDLQAKQKEQRTDLIDCQQQNAKIEADFRQYLMEQNRKKINTVDSLNNTTQ